jgi:Tfp pilus assembly protein PilX
MKTLKQFVYRMRPGAALIVSMIFVLVFSALAVSLATISGTNVQLANNQRQANYALTSAQSGLEALRYYLTGLKVPGSVQPADRLSAVAAALNSKGFSASYTNHTITIPTMTINTSSNQTFSVTMGCDIDYDTVVADIIGTGRNEVTRKLRVTFNFENVGNSVFDFGIATKGPLRTHGSIEIEGLNERVEASVYIESLNSLLALEMIGKSSIAGDVSIVNPLANAAIGNSSSVGGETGTNAEDHVFIGAPPSDFPTPNPGEFAPFVQNIFIPGTTPTSNVTLQNMRIPANANPSFSGNVIIEGILFIEPPNAVTFNGNTQITGVIVANGSLDAPSSGNSVQFLGTVDSHDMNQLPDEGFAELKEKQGTFLLAPGFSTSFSGNFATINGVIAASGIAFSGNAGGTINGSVVNYSDAQMTLDGNTDLIFNRSGADANPPGFGPSKVLRFQPSSYSEVM